MSATGVLIIGVFLFVLGITVLVLFFELCANVRSIRRAAEAGAQAVSRPPPMAAQYLPPPPGLVQQVGGGQPPT